MNKAIPSTLALALLIQTNFAAAGTRYYAMWSPTAENLEYPVYIYSNGEQVGYIASAEMQVFSGPYAPSVTDGDYHLYFSEGGFWYGCLFALSKGSIDTSRTTCPGAVINPPVSQSGATSNVYTFATGLLPWEKLHQPPRPAPISVSYASRTITFVNKMKYRSITIGESCNVNTGKNSTPSCQNNQIIAKIDQGRKYVVDIPLDGLKSSAFYLSAYCTGTEEECGAEPSTQQCGTGGDPPPGWVCTGGYFDGQQPYATKIEPTVLSVDKGIPTGASNIDVSAVDGFNAGLKLYPAQATYCTYTVPPEDSNILGVGSYDSESPLAAVVPDSPDSLQELCKNSSQLPTNSDHDAPWNLQKTSRSGAFEGCLSPCTYARTHNDPSSDKYCCTGRYSSPQECTAAARTSYNANLLKSDQFLHVYGYAFGDAGNDYACPPQTNFVVEFLSPADSSSNG